MNFPEAFSYSQSNLQDFTDCERRFLLRHIQRLNYPAPQSEPIRSFERHMQQGSAFHHLVHQHLSGVSLADLQRALPDEQVADWFSAYLAHGLTALPNQRHSEIALTAPLGSARLIAKYDLIAIEPGQRAVIVDWKTSLRKPPRETLARRLQTVVYPYLLAVAGAHLNDGQPIPPEHISMIYWFANDPTHPEVFTYDRVAFDHATARLTALAADIESRPDEADAFPKTEDERRCAFCTYRTLCGRGFQAGDILTTDIDTEGQDFTIDLIFDQIAEIAF